MLLIGSLLMLSVAGITAGLMLIRRPETGGPPGPEEGGPPRPEEGGPPGPEEGAPPHVGEDEALPRRPLAGLLRRFRLDTYEEQLRWAGRPLGLDAAQVVILKLVLAVALPVLLLGLGDLGALTLPALLLGGLAGFLAPDVWLTGKVAERRRMVAEELPLFADLVAAAVSAGLPLTEAVRRVAADAPGLVAREFLRTVQEMAAGRQRQEAWRDLTARLPGEELRSVVGAIMQAEQYGTSVADLLRYQVQQIRLFKQQEAQRIAQTVTVKMRIPMERAQ